MTLYQFQSVLPYALLFIAGIGAYLFGVWKGWWEL